MPTQQHRPHRDGRVGDGSSSGESGVRRGEELDPTKITSYHPKLTPPHVAHALAKRLGITYLDGVLALQIKSVELHSSAAQDERGSFSSDKKRRKPGGLFSSFFRRRRSNSRIEVMTPRERRCRFTVEFPRFDYQSPHYALDSSGRAGSFTDSVEIAVSPSDLPVVLVTAFEAGPDGSEKQLGCVSLRFDVMAIEGRIAEAFFPLGALPLASESAIIGRLMCRLAFSGRPVARETAEAEGAGAASGGAVQGRVTSYVLESVTESPRSSNHSRRPSPRPVASPPAPQPRYPLPPVRGAPALKRGGLPGAPPSESRPVTPTGADGRLDIYDGLDPSATVYV
eukprot:tig00001128_g7178.t1